MIATGETIRTHSTRLIRLKVFHGKCPWLDGSGRVQISLVIGVVLVKPTLLKST